MIRSKTVERIDPMAHPDAWRGSANVNRAPLRPQADTGPVSGSAGPVLRIGRLRTMTPGTEVAKASAPG